MTHPSPAATVAIISDTDDGIHILMVQRHQQLANSGGAWAFPGGRVEQSDYTKHDDHFLASKIAAVRETKEETNLHIHQDDLIPFAHWTTPIGPKKRFATWFFLCKMGTVSNVVVDGSEIVDHVWMAPSDVLTQHREGNMTITPPGFVTLNRLQQCNNSRDAQQLFSNQEIAHYNPKLIKHIDQRIIFYEGDAGYDKCEIDITGKRNRIIMNGNDWVYENTLTARAN